jgi:hypothetical protein
MIPTAKEFWNESCKNDELKSPADIMIEFAKLHVEAALKEAYKNIEYTDADSSVLYVVEDSILNAYPLENIK